MDTNVLKRAQTAWEAGDSRFRNIYEGEWSELPNSPGCKPDILEGIRGRSGAYSVSDDGEQIGLDMIEMQPGSAFPEHVHAGDHILLVLSGAGELLINGAHRSFSRGDSVYIRARDPHAVIGPPVGATEPLVVVFFSKPHKHLEDKTRMEAPDGAHGHSHDNDHDLYD